VNLTARLGLFVYMYKKCDKKLHNSIKEHFECKKQQKQRQIRKKEKNSAKAGIETATFWLKK
jgi:hypothetical protein